MKSEYFVMPDQWKTVTPEIYGFEVCKKGHTWSPANRRYYLLHYIFKGTGTVEQHGKIFTAGKDDLIVHEPGDTTSWYFADKEDPWIYAWLGFRVDPLLPPFSNMVIHAPSARNIFSALQECENEFPTDRIYSLIHDLLQLFGQKDTTKAPRNYAEIAKVYLDNSSYQVPIEKIAKALHIDRRYLTTLFRKAYGLTPQQYQMKLRMEKARELLMNGFSVTDASVRSGFSDLSNFSKKYKQYYGETPQQAKTKSSAS